MSLPRALSSRFVCNACRSARPSSIRVPRRALPCASFSTSVRQTDKQDQHAVDPESVESTTPTHETIETQQDLKVESTDETVEPATSAQPASIPWYLKQQSGARPPSQPAAEIPELPSNPPPILEKLLEYVSVTAGLDDLQLLDLRHLDPPPALGPKLIMIIATARSEKHLHVSADRFARWLRRDHGLKANAAGLLGRNELKIKLRRKAKRMRMLANVGGAVPEGNLDDGIRTGWICCTLSKVEAHPDDTHMPGDDVKEFVGFREVKPGVNIVVQMFTEEKRHETDLETLWGGVLRTHQRRDKSADETLREVEQDLKELEEDVDLDEDEPDARRAAPAVSKPPSKDAVGTQKESPPPLQFRKPRPTAGDPFPSMSDLPPKRQVRRLHTVGLR
jgi:ribosomal silencing factor RsfS